MLAKDGVYYTDHKLRALFVHERDDFSLNFTGPFLMECGFPVSRKFLRDFLDKLMPVDEHACLREHIQPILIITHNGGL